MLCLSETLSHFACRRRTSLKKKKKKSSAQNILAPLNRHRQRSSKHRGKGSA